MTDNQRKIFGEILELNWDMNRETNATKKFELLGQLTQKKIDLKKDMGEAEYDKFMSMGQKMFAPKTS